MDKLEGSVLPLNSEQTLVLMKGLEDMAESLIGGLEKTIIKVQNIKFQGKDHQLKVQQDFHSLLALADKQFMEHVGLCYLARFRQNRKFKRPSRTIVHLLKNSNKKTPRKHLIS